MKKIIALSATVAALGMAVWTFWRRFLPKTEGVLLVPGLEGTVEIVRDSWGVPHIYASSEADLFFAQGYVHAQDRLWQMELQRRAGAGRLSEVLGEATLEIDRFARVLGLHRAAQAEWAALPGETRQALEAYAAGINAYIASRPGRLSVEFALLRFPPEPWQPVDSICWSKMMALNLSANWASEVLRAKLASRLGAAMAADLEPAYPADNPTVVPGSGLTAGNEPPPNGWGSQALREALELAASLFSTGPQPATASTPPGIAPGLTLAGGASNQWVVDGRRTETGKPLLANDTHMSVAMPALWYQVHLVGGRYDVAGVSMPGTPGVVIGHNRHCAWGMTTAWQDVQDLYVERLNPDNPHQVEVDGRWLDAQVVQEAISVKGREAPVVEEVVITRHGPIVSGLTGEPVPLALRWAALEPSDLIGSALAASRAAGWEEFRQGLAGWAAPPHNFVYADVAGNIGFIQAGWVPVRAKGYGMAPVPGWSSEYEWQRYLTVDEWPQAQNPESGWIGVANNLVVDPNYPHFISADLENPCRAARLVHLITSQDKVTIGDFARFQLDTYSAQAERFAGHLARLQPTNQREHDALTYLREWDHRLEPDSVAASLYHVCRLRALHLVFDAYLGDLAAAYVGVGTTSLSAASPYHGRSFVRLLDMLDKPGDTYWMRDAQTGIPQLPSEVLHRALRQALKLLREQLGDDMAQWTWGRLNRIHFAHPIGSVKPFNLVFNRGPYPLGGDHDTLLRASGKPSFPLEPVAVVDALRFIADPSDWDRCRIMIPGGQSGHVASRHYADRIPLWRQGLLLSMPYSRAAVMRQARGRLVLAGAR